METKKQHKILICLGSSCYSRGNADNLKTINEYLKENNLEAEVDFRGHLCHEMCPKSPVIEINGQTYEEVTQSNLPSILKHHFEPAPCS